MLNTLLRYSFHIITGVAIILYGWVWTRYEQPVEMAQAITRLTARVSLVIFFFVFSASAWQRLALGGWAKDILQNRRRLGLTFAYSHTIHLVCIVVFFVLIKRWPSLATMIVAGGAYLTMYAMAFTSNDGAIRKLGAKNWKRLHTFGIYYLWLIFFLTYLPRLLAANDNGSPKFGGNKVEFMIGMTLVLLMMLFRIAAYIHCYRKLRDQ